MTPSQLYTAANLDPNSTAPNHREAVSRAADSFEREMQEYGIDDTQEIWERAGGVGPTPTE